MSLLAAGEPFFGLGLQGTGTRVLDALDLGLKGNLCALATRSLGSGALADSGDLTGTPQSDMSFEVMLCNF